VATALIDGAVTLSSFTDERLHRGEMQALLGKIAVTMTPDITTQYNAGRYVDLDIELADGTSVHERCERPRGSWGAEPISEAEHIVKVRDCLAGSLAPSAIDDFLELGTRFEQLDGNGVRTMLALAGGEARA
jgi:2-methylcitrate dehydratase PrpD